MSDREGTGNRTGETDQGLDALVCEVSAKLEAGEPVDLEAIAEEHPQHVERLRRVLPTLRAMAELGHADAASLLSSPERTDRPGTTSHSLGDFRIVREIGRGGMGVVYEAEQISLDRRVALKVLPFAAVMDPRQLQRFKNEARAAAMLDHPNIVGIYSVGCERGVHYYAMQYVEGQTVAQVIDELRRIAGADASEEVHTAVSQLTRDLTSGRLWPSSDGAEGQGLGDSSGSEARPECGTARPEPSPPAAETHARPEAGISTKSATGTRGFFRSVARLGIQAAEALEHAHQTGVVHRDVKPSNLMIDATGHVWITDFGLAMTGTDANLTMTGDVLGTLRYMSPEQALGKNRILDQRTDTYSLGVTLYELLTLRPVFGGEDRQRLLRQIAEADPLPPRRINRAIPGDLETIVLKATAKEPAARYQTAQELADDLGRFLEHKPIQARRPTLLERLTKWSRRHRSVVASAFLVMLIALMGFAVSTLLIGRQRDRAEAERQRAEDFAKELRQRLYAADVNRAHQAWLNADIAQVLTLLERCCPGDGEEDLRGFEWHYLWQLCHSERLSLRGHEGEVYFVAFSPDGRQIATASEDGTARLWDAAGGRLQMTLRGHTGDVNGVAFSPDGKTLASAGEDRTVRLWDLATGNERAVLRGHTDEVFNAVFSPDGEIIASGGGDDLLKLWDAATGQEQATLEPQINNLEFLAFSPDGKTFAAAGSTLLSAAVKLWDVATWENTATLLGQTGSVLSVAFSPDGRILATGSSGSTVKFWDAADAGEKATLRGHGNSVQGVAFSPDGRTLVSGSRDATVRFWDVETGKLRHILRGHVGRVWSVAFSPDGRTLATAGADRTVKLWHADAGQEFRKRPCEASNVQAASLSTDGRALAARSHGPDPSVLVYRWEQGTEPPLRIPRGFPSGTVALAPDAQYLAVDREDGTVDLWDLATGGKRLALRGPLLHISCIAFSPHGHLLAADNEHRNVVLWDLPSGSDPTVLHHPTGAVNGVAFSPNGETLATASEDASVKLWDLHAATVRLALAGHLAGVCDVDFSVDGNSLASASKDGTVRLWDVTTGRQRLALPGHTGAVRCVRFSPDRKTLASGSDDGTIKLWNAAIGQELFTLAGHTGSVRCLAFSKDGASLVSCAVRRDGQAEWYCWPSKVHDNRDD